jgi:hypothetical protein
MEATKSGIGSRDKTRQDKNGKHGRKWTIVARINTVGCREDMMDMTCGTWFKAIDGR